MFLHRFLTGSLTSSQSLKPSIGGQLGTCQEAGSVNSLSLCDSAVNWRVARRVPERSGHFKWIVGQHLGIVINLFQVMHTGPEKSGIV